MKKTILTIALVATVGFTGYHIAEARPGGGPGFGGGSGYGECCGPGGGWGRGAMDEESWQAREEFRAETSELRKEMAVKQAQLQAALNGGDEARAGQLAEELFGLRDQMRTQAQAAGLHRGSAGNNSSGETTRRGGSGRNR